MFNVDFIQNFIVFKKGFHMTLPVARMMSDAAAEQRGRLSGRFGKFVFVRKTCNIYAVNKY